MLFFFFFPFPKLKKGDDLQNANDIGPIRAWEGDAEVPSLQVGSCARTTMGQVVACWGTPLCPNLCIMGRNMSLNPLLGCLCHVFLKKKNPTESSPLRFPGHRWVSQGLPGGPTLPQFRAKVPPCSLMQLGRELRRGKGFPCTGLGSLGVSCGDGAVPGHGWKTLPTFGEGKGLSPFYAPLLIRPACTPGRLAYFKILIRI